MDYKTKLIEQLEELEADNTQHPSFYDGYGFAISDAIETIKKFNYIPCCTELKEKEEITFDKWLKMWGWEQVGNSYVFKRGESYTDAESLMISYKKEYNL